MASQIDFIVSSPKPYPEWLKQHQVFKKLGKIDKIFPRIGLSNFKEDVDIIASSEAQTAATQLGQIISSNLSTLTGSLYTLYRSKLTTMPPSREKNELCNKIWHTHAINYCLYLTMSHGPSEYIKTVENKVVMSLANDVFSGADSAPIFRSGEPLFRVINKLNSLLTEVGLSIIDYEQLPEFKTFSKANIPGAKYEVIFSADGEQGAWDIATMSMRGGSTWSSCQAWDRPQSRGLIGSVASKFVGVIYVASKSEEIKPYGSKMLYRCAVRLAFHNTTREPTIILDTMYPSFNRDVDQTMKKLLISKSGLKVVCSGEQKDYIMQNYSILDERSRSFLASGELSYMDSPLTIRSDRHLLVRKLTQADTSQISSAKEKIIKAVEKLVFDWRNGSDIKTYLKDLDTYKIDKTKWEKTDKLQLPVNMQSFDKPKPKLVSTIDASCLNFLKHCDKQYGDNSAAKLFINPILDRIKFPENCLSEAHCYRHIIFELNRNKSIIDESWTQLKAGTWSAHFPKASERFFKSVIQDLRKAVLDLCKNSKKNEAESKNQLPPRSEFELWLRRKPNYRDY